MNEPNYQEAFEELQQIVADMEEGQISVDELTEKVDRAATLLRICKAKLNAAEQDVQEILSSIGNQEIMDNVNASQNDPDEEKEIEEEENTDEQSDVFEKTEENGSEESEEEE